MYQEYILPILLLTAAGLVAGVMLMLAAKFMAVSKDEKYELVRALLPGANCGACGFAGCDDYAAQLANGDVPANLCLPGGERVTKRIARTLGKDAVDIVPMAATVGCSCGATERNLKMHYRGRPSCVAANMFYKGNLACDHGCLGFGDCVKACKFGAISIQNGLAVVDKKRCTGCGKCALVCPHHVIYMRPHAGRIYVGCVNPKTGAQTRQECKYGCIGCHKCEKACPTGAIKLDGHLAWTFPELCIHCDACVDVCPVGVIHNCYQPETPETPEAAIIPEAPLRPETGAE